MAWNETVTQFTIGTSNHADNFNEVHNKLLENDKHLKESIASESTSREEADVALSQQISILSAKMIGIGDFAKTVSNETELNKSGYYKGLNITGFPIQGTVTIDLTVYNANFKSCLVCELSNSGIFIITKYAEQDWKIKKITTEDEMNVLLTHKVDIGSQTNLDDLFLLTGLPKIQGNVAKVTSGTQTTPYLFNGGAYTIEETYINASYGFQYATSYNKSSYGGYTIFREKQNGVWQSWKPIATTDKVDILSSTATITDPLTQVKMQNGWSADAPTSAVKIGNTVFIEGILYGSVNTINTIVFTLPSSFSPKSIKYLNVINGAGSNNILKIFVKNNGDVVLNQDMGTSYLRFNCFYNI